MRAVGHGQAAPNRALLTNARMAPPAAEIAILYQVARLGNMQDILRRVHYLSRLGERYPSVQGADGTIVTTTRP